MAPREELNEVPDRELVIELAAEKFARALAKKMSGIVPDRVYTAEDACELLGMQQPRRVKTLREIPRSLLPTVQITSRHVGYLGSDLLAYIRGQRKAS